MAQNLNVLIQYLVPQHALSRLGGFIANCRWPWLKNYFIRSIINKHQIDMKSALLESIDDYPSFNSFFTRYLKPDARPIVSGPHEIASPVDGCISQIGKIKQDTLVQAKGIDYDLLHLLGGNKKYAELFTDGSFATLYLAPPDYHRVHMPIAGSLQETIYIPGKLFSVNKSTTAAIPQLFTRNERLICLFNTEIGPMAIIMVGAIFVGSIDTVWQKKITSKNGTQSYAESIHLQCGAELGNFNMGSTVIVLFAKNKIDWAGNLQENSIVRMGGLLATCVNTPKRKG